MQVLKNFNIFLYIWLLLLLLSLTFKVMAYEEATYSTVYKNAVYEIRSYNDRLAVQVNYNNQGGGFRRLFNYISGFNIDSTKIKMTIPAIQFDENGSKVIQFFLPANFTKKNAPAPNDKDLKLIINEQGYYAVIQFSGRLNDKNFNKYKGILKDSLLKKNIEILSSSIRASYNAPFTLPFLRRNEVMFRVKWNN